eukprot:COSAG01_NODE_10506_length_2149_cov_5.011707_1_plen_63_part_10
MASTAEIRGSRGSQNGDPAGIPVFRPSARASAQRSCPECAAADNNKAARDMVILFSQKVEAAL